MAVSAEWKGGLVAVTIDLAEGHRWIGDEPEWLGGTNLGPNPFTLLQASLANCSLVTVAGEAELMGADLTSLHVEVRHKQNLVVRGPRDPEQRKLRMTALRVHVSVAGSVTENQIERLRWAAENCPVSNSIGPAIPIDVTIGHNRSVS